MGLRFPEFRYRFYKTSKFNIFYFETESMDPPTPPRLRHHRATSTHLVASSFRSNRDRSEQQQQERQQSRVHKPPDEALTTAVVYQWWTGEPDPLAAPWIQADKENTSLTPADLSRHPMGSRSARGNAIARLDADLCRAIQRGNPNCLPFCGKTEILGNHKNGTPPMRLMLVFWAPSRLTALRQNLHISGTGEEEILDRLDRLLLSKNLGAVVTVAYLLPRWAPPPSAYDPTTCGTTGRLISEFRRPPRTGVEAPGAGHSTRNGRISKLKSTHPSLLSYGVWQLGLRICLTRPQAIISTNADLARIVAHTAGLDPRHLCTESARQVVAGLPPPPREPVLEPATIQVHFNSDEVKIDPREPQRRGLEQCAWNPKTTIQRRVIDLNRLPKQQKSITLKHTPTHHLRMPHPFLLTRQPRDAQDHAALRADTAWFFGAVDLLVELGQTLAESDTGQAMAAAAPKAVLRLGGVKRKQHPHASVENSQTFPERQCYLVKPVASPPKRLKHMAETIVID